MTKRTMKISKRKRKESKREEFQPFEDSGVDCEICGEPLDLVEVVDGNNVCWLCQEMLNELEEESSNLD